MSTLYQAVRAMHEVSNASVLRFPLGLFSGLGAFLTRPFIPDDPTYLYHFMSAYLSSSKVIRSWFYSSIEDLSLREDLNAAAYTLDLLYRYGLFDEDIVYLLNRQANVVDVADSIHFLIKMNLLNTDNLYFVITHSKPIDMCVAIVYLQKNRLLTAEYRFSVSMHQKPRELAHGYVHLHRAGIFTADNRERLFTHDKPKHLAHAYTMLHQTNILTLDNKNALWAYRSSRNFDLMNMAQGIRILDEHRILTPDNRAALLVEEYSQVLMCIMFRLVNAGLLDQSNFALITNPANRILLDKGLLERLWDAFTPLRLEENWERIVEAVQASNPEQALHLIIRDNLGGYDDLRGALNARVGRVQFEDERGTVFGSAAGFFSGTHGRDNDQVPLKAPCPMVAKCASFS